MLDSPGVPPSAGAHQLFRGFSFVATALLEEEGTEESAQAPPHPVVQVSALYVSVICKTPPPHCPSAGFRILSFELPCIIVSSESST